MPRKPKKIIEEAPQPLPSQATNLYFVRGQYVVLDFEVAKFFGVETRRLNEQVTRNAEKFGDDFAFRLTSDEVANLRSQNAISSDEWGGSRYAPRVFTEHGVVMAATLLKTPRAIQATRLVVKTFVEIRRQIIQKAEISGGSASRQTSLPLEFRDQLMTKVSRAIAHVLDAMVNPDEVKKAREEAKGVLASSVKSLKEILSKPGIDNEHKVAEIRKLMAEAENIEVETDGKRLRNEEQQLALLAKKLSLVMQAQHFAQTGQVDDFLRLLGELGAQPATKMISNKP